MWIKERVREIQKGGGDISLANRVHEIDAFSDLSMAQTTSGHLVDIIHTPLFCLSI
jgi:hypothetical protein